MYVMRAWGVVLLLMAGCSVHAENPQFEVLEAGEPGPEAGGDIEQPQEARAPTPESGGQGDAPSPDAASDGPMTDGPESDGPVCGSTYYVNYGPGVADAGPAAMCCTYTVQLSQDVTRTVIELCTDPTVFCNTSTKSCFDKSTNVPLGPIENCQMATGCP